MDLPQFGERKLPGPQGTEEPLPVAFNILSLVALNVTEIQPCCGRTAYSLDAGAESVQHPPRARKFGGFKPFHSLTGNNFESWLRHNPI